MKKTNNKMLSSSELSFFCMQIGLILKSGLLISDGIDTIYKDLEESRVKYVLKNIKENLDNKVPIYIAMEKEKCFPDYLVNMCQIGTVTGKLEDVMFSLSEYYDREQFIRLKIKNSIFYPAVLFILMSVVIILLVTKIFPIFEGMIKELGGDLINSSNSLMSFSTGILAGKLTMYLIIILLAIALVVFILYKIGKGKIVLDFVLNKIPFTNKILNKIIAYRFSASMSLLLSSGMDIEKSINILSDITEGSNLKNKIEICRKFMNEGNSFIESLSQMKIFSDLHVQLLNMGQKTGEMDNVMKKLTAIYEEEADYAINSAVAVVEPVIVGILSVVIGIILISVMLPLMNIMSAIG